MYKGKVISIVIPCHNEEKGLPRVLNTLPDFVDEVLVVDNASSDRTVEVANFYKAKVICHSVNKGYGASYKSGFFQARGDIIVTGDGDGTYPLKYCQQFIDVLLEKNLDFISGCRFPLINPKSMNLTNKIGNRLITLTMNLLFGLRIHDSLSGMWVFKREMLNFLGRIESDGFSFSNEIKILAFKNSRIKAAEVPIVYEKRKGKSKLFPWTEGFKIVMFLIKRRLWKYKL